MRDPLAYLPNFLFKAWREMGLPDPTPLQYDFCSYLDSGYIAELQGHAEKGDVGARKILMAFRGASKSYVTTAYAVCRLRRDRSELVLVVSATSGFAGGIANFAYQMVSNFEWLSDMKPRNDQRRSALKFDVAGCPAAVKDESFASEGLFGQITGRRASVIIGDDLETPGTSDTEGKRTLLKNRMGEFGAIIKPGGDIFLLGTAQTEETVYKDYADERGYEMRIYPILHPKLDSDPKVDEGKRYGTRLAPFVRKAVETNPYLAGTSVEPSRFTEGDILSRKQEWGKIEFERQFLMYLDGAAGKAKPLRLRDLIALEIEAPTPASPELKLPSDLRWAPDNKLAATDLQVDSLSGDSHVFFPAVCDTWVPAEEVSCFVDTSGSGMDETTWTIVGGLLGRVFLLHQGASLEGHTEVTMEAIAKDCKRWRCGTIEVEENFGGGMFASLLIPKLADISHPCNVETIKAGQTMKEKRIVETLEPLVTDHRLVVNAAVLRADYPVAYPDVEERFRRFYRLTYQFTRMVPIKGAVRHDDRVDGLAGACRRYIGVLLRQLSRAKDAGVVQTIEQEVEMMLEARRKQGLPLLGAPPTPDARFGRPSPRRSSKTPAVR